MLGRLLLLVFALALAAAVFLVGRFVIDKVTRRDTSDRPPPWRDLNVLSLAAQVLALGLIVTVGSWLWTNFRDRTDDIGLELTFGFLDQPSGISIADNPLSSNAGIRDALQQGVKKHVFDNPVGDSSFYPVRNPHWYRTPVDQLAVAEAGNRIRRVLQEHPALAGDCVLVGSRFSQFPIRGESDSGSRLAALRRLDDLQQQSIRVPLDCRFGQLRGLPTARRGQRCRSRGCLGMADSGVQQHGCSAPQGAVVLGYLGRGVRGVLLGAGRAVRVLQDHRRGSDLVGWLSDANALCGGDVGACHLHGLAYRRDCSGQHPGGTPRASGGLPCSGPEWFATVPVRDTASGLPDCLPTVDQPVPKLHQELFIGGGDRFR